jgi:hypothetical protein
MNQEIVQYNILKRQADSNRSLYDTLLQRLKEAEISSSLMASNVRIVDRAELPTHAVRPVKTQSLLNGLAVGMALGVGLAFFQEYMDRSFKSPDDVTKYLKLPTLAIVPRMASVMGKNGGPKGVSAFLSGARKAKAETNGHERCSPRGRSRRTRAAHGALNGRPRLARSRRPMSSTTASCGPSSAASRPVIRA